ncbi:MAG: hypothetical protein IPO60_18190 [Flavobacteriales bacterium]|nr:hypothetical protein [Flavobacteriales bacterium]
MSGMFDFADNSIRNLMQLVDTAWEPLCSYCLQGGFDSGGQMAVYKDELYIGGRSHYSSGNPGQGGLRWDGEQASPTTGAANAVFYHDTLYISAGFGNGFMRYLGDDIRYQCSTLGIDGNSPAKEVFGRHGRLPVC